MEPIPKPLLRRLVLTFMVGTGCFFIGLIFFLHDKDTSFFVLSSLLFAGSAVKGIQLCLQIKSKTYVILEGTCTDVRPKLFRNQRDVLLTDKDGNEQHLLVGKDHKIRPGLSYRFYFKYPDRIPPGQNTFLTKAASTDNLLGMEEINETSSHTYNSHQ